jgi:hypothetical protein
MTGRKIYFRGTLYIDKANKNLKWVQCKFSIIFLSKQPLFYQYYDAMSLISNTQFGYCLIFKYIQNKKFSDTHERIIYLLSNERLFTERIKNRDFFLRI